MGQISTRTRPGPDLRTSARAAVVAALVLGFGVAGAQDIKGDAARGQSKTSMCAGCHGIPDYRTSYPMVYSVPLIGGQNPKYIEAALREYRKGDRKHPTMRAIAGSLSDQDIADLAAYYGADK